MNHHVDKPWSRTDTQRWLDDRAAAVHAHYETVLKRPIPRCVRFPGQWLYNKLPKNFSHAHDQLERCGQDVRQVVPVETVLPPKGLAKIDGEKLCTRGRTVSKGGPCGRRKKHVRTAL